MLRSQLAANKFAQIHGLQSETGTPARNALSEHYPPTGLEIPLTAFNLDASGRGFADPAEPHALYRPPNFREFLILTFSCIFCDSACESPPACVQKYQFLVDFHRSAHVDPSLRPTFLRKTTPGQSNTGAFAFFTHFFAFCAYFTTMKSTIFHRNSRKVTIMHTNWR